VSAINLFFLGYGYLMFMPAKNSFNFVVWMLSLSICEHFKFLRLALQNQSNENKSQIITMIRKSFAEMRMIITDLDQSMSLVFKHLYNNDHHIFINFLLGIFFLFLKN